MGSMRYILQLSLSDYKEKIATIFNAPVDQIYLSDEFLLDQEQYVAVFQQILYLSSLYDLRHLTTQKVVFESEATYYGKVTRDLYNLGQNITCINFGDKPRAAFSNGRFSKRLSESAVDKVVVTHEFAHVVSGKARAAGPAETRYWEELEELWQSYQEFKQALVAYGDHISEYSFTDIDEFHAEAFTEYHLSDKPSEYAISVGESINKYFCKK